MSLVHPETYAIQGFDREADRTVCRLLSDGGGVEFIEIDSDIGIDVLDGHIHSIWAAWRVFSEFLPGDVKKTLSLSIRCLEESGRNDLDDLSRFFGKPYGNPAPSLVSLSGRGAYAIGDSGGYPVFIWRILRDAYIVSLVDRRMRKVETGVLPGGYLL